MSSNQKNYNRLFQLGGVSLEVSLKGQLARGLKLLFNPL